MMLVFAAIPHVVAFPGAILFGCAILLAVRILAGESENADALHQTLRRVAWQLIVAGVMAILLAAGIVPGIVALIVLPAVVHRRRRAHRYALLAAMGVAVERRIPLIPVLLAFATERRGFVARRAMELAARLQAGWSLPDAVDSSHGLFSPQVRLLIRMGHDSGNLGSAIHEVVDRSDTSDTLEAQITGKIIYLAIVALVLLGTTVFIMMKIIPAMQRIFDEFGANLPSLTILLVQVSYAAVNLWFLAIPFVAVAFAVGLHSTLRYMGVVEHDMIGTTWLRRRLHSAMILEALAMFSKAERPIVEAISGLARCYPTDSVRRRLVRALADMQDGREWCDALAGRRLISRADRGLLRAAQHVGNLPWAFAEAAESNRRRFAIRANAFMQSTFVVALLGCGVLVMFFFIGNFLPIIKLIASLS
jgi:type II secretory pathway component PulF